MIAKYVLGKLIFPGKSPTTKEQQKHGCLTIFYFVSLSALASLFPLDFTFKSEHSVSVIDTEEHLPVVCSANSHTTTPKQNQLCQPESVCTILSFNLLFSLSSSTHDILLA